MLADRHRVLAVRGPLTLVAAHRASPEERRRAYAPREAARIVRTLGLTETGDVLVVPGWGWVREVEPEDAVAPPRPAPVLTPSQLRGLATKAFELTLVEAGTGRALVDVPFAVVTPDGDERRVETDGAGRVRIPDLPPGECAVESLIDDARVETSYAAVQPGAVAADGGRRSAPLAGHLVVIQRHHVRGGETPESIAVAYDVPWERIAGFNWGTTEPDALETHYRDTLGCTRRTADGRLRFDDADAPGILLVPRPWRARLAVGVAHELFVAPLRPLFLCLENEARLRIPGAAFQARFADGTTRRGQVGPGGIARLDGVPEGSFTVSYADEFELLSGSLAVSVRRALGESATAPLFTLLMQSQEVVTRAAATYDRYLNDLTGGGLAADIDQIVTDPDARRPLLALCALAGLPVEGAGGVRLAT